MTTTILPTTAVPVWLFSQNADGTLSPATVGGGGSGTVNSGTANQIAYYASTGTAVSGDTLFTDNGTTLGYTGTGGISGTRGLSAGKVGTAGVLTLVGSTSGTATFTAPAVAGTTTNPVVASNAITMPDGTAANPSINFSGFTNYGFWFDSRAGVGYSNNGAEEFVFTGSGTLLPSNASYGFTSGLLGVGVTPDTSVSRGASAGIITIGNGTAGDFSGTIKATGFNSAGTAGVSAGPFTAVTSIQSIAGIVTTLGGTSDERLKNSKAYEGGLAEIEAITPAKYTWNEKGQEHTGFSGEQEFVGFIAQDVQKAIPEAITATEKSRDGSETYLSLDDRPIVAALVNAVKELSARVKELEAR